jgi:hypothetical protein
MHYKLISRNEIEMFILPCSYHFLKRGSMGAINSKKRGSMGAKNSEKGGQWELTNLKKGVNGS